MADRDVKIGIKTTADTSGALAAKKSIEQLIVARKPLEDVRSQFMSAREAEVAEINRMVASAKAARPQLDGMAASVKKLDAAVDAAGRSNRMMGGNMQNVGYQVADFAVQLEGGTSALRAFSQQGSQILGAFGPWGAVAGAVLAVTAAIFSAKNGMAEAKEESDDLEAALDDLAETAAKAITAFKVDQFTKATGEFEARTVAIGRMNEGLKRQLELAKALADIEIAKKDIGAAAEIRRIEADPSLSDDEKFARTAKIKEGIEDRELMKRRNEILYAETKAKLDRDEAAKKVGSEEKKVSALEASETAAAQNVANAAAEAAARDAAKKRADEIKQRLSGISGEFAMLGASTSPGAPPSEFAKSEMERLLKERKALEKEQAGVQGFLGKGSDEEAAKAYEEAKEIHDAVIKDVASAREELEKFTQAFQDAEEILSQVTTIGAAERGLLGEQEKANESNRGSDRQSYESAMSKRAKEKADAEEERKRNEAERLSDAQRDLETDITGIGRNAAESTRGLGARGIDPEGFNRLAAKIARKGDPQGDKLNLAAFLEKVSMLVDAIPDSKASSEDAEKLKQVERKLEKKIADLNSRVTRNEAR